MVPVIHLGPLSLWSYGLMMGLAFVAGYWLGEIDFRRRGLPIPMSAFLPGLIVGGLIFGRLDHLLVVQLVLQHQKLSSLRWDGFTTFGYTYFGGLFGGFLAFVAVSRAYRVPLLKVLDGAPIVCLCYAIGRIGCFLAGDGDYGVPTSLPWGMAFPHGLVPTIVPVHPVPLYEAAYSLAIFLILWPRGRAETYAHLPQGSLFADALLWTGICRFSIQFVSRNGKLFAGLTEAQIVSIAFVLGGLALKRRFLQSAAYSSPESPQSPAVTLPS
jgi:phosphatidylglycerol:prolipoprotein diacylglycerol transferase